LPLRKGYTGSKSAGRSRYAELEAVARTDGKAVSESVREAIDALIAERRKDKEFQARLRKMIEEDRAVLDRLAR
jgi:hypothetical protein